MLPRSIFLPLFFSLISYSLCFSTFRNDPFDNFVPDQTPGYDLSSYYEDRNDEFEPSFAELGTDYYDEVIDYSMGYDRRGIPATGRGEVNVDDFGAAYSMGYDRRGTPATRRGEVNVDDFGAYYSMGYDRRGTPATGRGEVNVDDFGAYYSMGYDRRGNPATGRGEVNVDDFGAEGDGKTDDTQAFKKAWRKTCYSYVGGVLVVPKKKYHLRQMNFTGPCKSHSVQLKILGTIIASNNRWEYRRDRRHWLVFENITNFIVEADQGTINGNGEIWWKNSCKIDESQPCLPAPTAVTFYGCKNLRVYGLNVRDAQQMHVRFEESVNVEAYNFMLNAPENSPNTDGIHVTGSQNVQIFSSVIRTGDDCISIVNGSRNVQATDITCGPGHGISIGSLGKNNSESHVSNVMVSRAKLTGTTNGVRIKTWQGGSGFAKNVLFQNILMKNVTNPIIIDQNYCDQETPCEEQESAVQVKDITYRNIRGTSAREIAIKFDCSKTFPCKGIVMQNIDLQLYDKDEDLEVNATCVNVMTLETRGGVSPQCSSE